MFLVERSRRAYRSVTALSIPVGYLLFGAQHDNVAMKLSARKQVRRERLQKLMDQRFSGRNVDLANEANTDWTLNLPAEDLPHQPASAGFLFPVAASPTPALPVAKNIFTVRY